MNLDTMLDRAAGATAATMCILSAAFALVVWWRVFFYRPAMLSKDSPAPEVPPAMTDAEVKSVVVACAVAMSAFSIRYLQLAGARFGHWGYGSFQYDINAVTTDMLVVAAVLYSIRQATHGVCGAYAVAFFAALAAASGIASYAWA